MTTNTPHNPPIKAGDLVYAVGPGHNPPHRASDLLVYSTKVEAIRLDGSYSASCPPELLATARFTIELGPDRPHLGFPKWTYQRYELGINIHRSKTEALQTFAEHARRRLDQAKCERERANQEVQWSECERERANQEVQWALTETTADITQADARELKERRGLDALRMAQIEELMARRHADLTAEEREAPQWLLMGLPPCPDYPHKSVLTALTNRLLLGNS